VSGHTPRYLECQFEERSEPVSVEAGMLLLGGGVGMIGEVLVCLFGGGVEGIWLYLLIVTCEWRIVSLSPRKWRKRAFLGPYPNMM